MPTKNSMHHCEKCGKQTLHIENTVNHLLQLFLGFTLGGLLAFFFGALWMIFAGLLIWVVFIWLPMIGLQKNPQCTVCGHRA